MMQKKKHLLLLNRLMRTELKKDIIPVPSKLSEEEVNKYFERLFVKKTEGENEYYVPIKSKVELKIDEELFKGLIKKPKVKMQLSKEEKMIKEEETKQKNALSTYDRFFKDYIKPMQLKRKAGENVSKDEIEVVKRYVKLSQSVKNIVKKEFPKLFERLLDPADKERQMRKQKLTEENKQLVKEIRTQAKEEKKTEPKNELKEEPNEKQTHSPTVELEVNDYISLMKLYPEVKKDKDNLRTMNIYFRDMALSLDFLSGLDSYLKFLLRLSQLELYNFILQVINNNWNISNSRENTKIYLDKYELNEFNKAYDIYNKYITIYENIKEEKRKNYKYKDTDIMNNYSTEIKEKIKEKVKSLNLSNNLNDVEIPILNLFKKEQKRMMKTMNE